jgi:hypothetical protein
MVGSIILHGSNTPKKKWLKVIENGRGTLSTQQVLYSWGFTRMQTTQNHILTGRGPYTFGSN